MKAGDHHSAVQRSAARGRAGQHMLRVPHNHSTHPAGHVAVLGGVQRHDARDLGLCLRLHLGEQRDADKCTVSEYL